MGTTVTQLVEPGVGALEREQVGLQSHGATVVGGPPFCGTKHRERPHRDRRIVARSRGHLLVGAGVGRRGGRATARSDDVEAPAAHHDEVGRHRRNRTVAGQRRCRECRVDRRGRRRRRGRRAMRARRVVADRGRRVAAEADRSRRVVSALDDTGGRGAPGCASGSSGGSPNCSTGWPSSALSMNSCHTLAG